MIFLLYFVVLDLIYGRPANHCTSDDFRYGQWQYGAHRCGLKDHYLPSAGVDQKNSKAEFYMADQSESDADTVLRSPYPWSQYCWQPLYCQPKPFSVTAFCDRVQGKRLLFVGDSVMYQAYSALYFQLGEKNVLLHQHDIAPTARLVLTSKRLGQICKGKARMYYIRNDLLSVHKECSRMIRGTDFCYDAEWKSTLPVIDYLILSTGHHVKSLDKDKQGKQEIIERTNAVVRHLGSAIGVLNRTQIIYMTTSYGHPNCSKTSTAVNSTVISSDATYEMLVAQYIESIPSFIREENYGWEYYHRNDLEAIKQFRSINATILDIGPMTLLRPDGHRFMEPADILSKVRKAVTTAEKCGDCLHYFLPSVVDNWIFALFNILR